MPKPFDSAAKELLAAQPEAWLRLLGLIPRDEPAPPVEVLDTDVSTLSRAVDGVLRVGGKQPFLVHIEFETRYHSGTGLRVLEDWVLLRLRSGLPGISVVLLLRPAADGPDVTGRFVEGDATDDTLLECRY